MSSVLFPLVFFLLLPLLVTKHVSSIYQTICLCHQVLHVIHHPHKEGRREGRTRQAVARLSKRIPPSSLPLSPAKLMRCATKAKLDWKERGLSKRCPRCETWPVDRGEGKFKRWWSWHLLGPPFFFLGMCC